MRTVVGGGRDTHDGHENSPILVFFSNLLEQAQTRLVPLWRGRHLVAATEGPSLPAAIMPVQPDARALLEAAVNQTFLGLQDDAALFALDLSELEEDRALELTPNGRYMDLRHVGLWLPPGDVAILASARGMLEWQRRHRFCGSCGAPAASGQGGHVRLCTNPECQEQIFPRTDPAVIMLVEHRPDDGGTPTCLLGHHGRLPTGAYSTLAGFVEPGENLEEAVAREVEEEAGIRVRDIVYVASQPWPFPGSLMVGFRARADATAITLGRDELEHAAWFSARDLRSFGEWTDETAQHRLPRRDSIARFLVDSWMAEVDPPLEE